MKELKMMQNALYFILKLFSFSRCLNFCLDFYDQVEKTAWWEIFDFKKGWFQNLGRHSLINKQLQ